MTLKPIAYIAGLVLALVLLTWGLWSFDPFNRRKAAETRATTAEVQAEVTASGAAIADTVSTNTAKVRKAAGDTRHALAASNDLDADVAIWSDGLDRVRAEGHAPANHGGGEPSNSDR